MSTVLQKSRFFEARKHLLFKTKTVRKGLNNREIYERKQESREKRATLVRTNPEIQAYLQWIREIQVKLKLSDNAFATALGISAQAISLWYRQTGHLPSIKVFRRLLILEKLSRIPINDVKIRFGVRFRR
jgi:DNA-binding transcriptional regulator YiaG